VRVNDRQPHHLQQFSIIRPPSADAPDRSSQLTPRWLENTMSFLAVLSLSSIGFISPVVAQVVADPSVGTVVTPNGTTFEITGGTTVGGSNLFHSFGQFDVPVGAAADFLNAPTIVNILARVTGGTPSFIQGLIQAQGTANLFLINPQGILFGQGAQLNIGGSFVATTADGLQFPGGAEFSGTSAVDPANPLLAVNPSALFFNQIAAQPIVNQSIAPAGINASGFPIFGLRVPDGRSLLLVGGDVGSLGGGLFALGGRIELGGLASTGTVGLTVNNNQLSLSFPDAVPRADVVLTNSAEVRVSGAGGGDIAVNARNLSLFGGSLIIAGISGNLGTVSTQAGDVTINTQGAIEIDGGSLIGNILVSQIFSQTGAVIINTESLSLTNGGRISGTVVGQGESRGVTINARDRVVVQGVGTLNDTSFIATGLARPDPLTVVAGKAGDITINTGSLLLTQGGQIRADSDGLGSAGNVFITARDAIVIDGASSGTSSGIASTLEATGAGQAGNITLNARSLSVSNGAIVSAGTAGAGQGGTITINTTDVTELAGTAANGTRSELSTVTDGSSDAGSINITTQRFIVRNGARVLTTANLGSTGQAGNLTINATDTVDLIGTSSFSPEDRSLLSAASGGTGKAGDLTINTGRLTVLGGAGVSTSVFDGPGGKLTVNATESIELRGAASGGSPTSALFTGTFGSGKAGDLVINTQRFTAIDGGTITTSVFSSQGQGGDLSINASESVLLSNGFLLTDTSGGKAGNLRIDTQSLSVRNGGRISTSTNATGQGGNLTINASELVEVDSPTTTRGIISGLFTGTTSDGKAGDLQINTKRLIVRNQSGISTTTLTGRGEGGNLFVNATEAIEIDGGFLVTGSLGSGDAGDLRIDTQNLSVRGGGQVSTETNTAGQGGDLIINASGTVELIGTSSDGQTRSGLVTETIGSRDAGDLFVNTSRLIVKDGAGVSTTSGAASTGKAGDLTIQATESVEVIGESLIIPGERSFLRTATGGTKDAGALTINTQRLRVQDGGAILTTVLPSSQGQGGKLTIRATNFVEVIGTALDSTTPSGLITGTFSNGKAGDLTIDTTRLLVQNGAAISTTVFENSQGQGGELTINATEFVEVSGVSRGGTPSSLLTGTLSNGNAGNLTLKTDRLFVQNGATIATTVVAGQGKGGDLSINATDSIELDNEGSIVTGTTGDGNAGNLRITAGSLDLRNQSAIATNSEGGIGNAGDVEVNVRGDLKVQDSDISSAANTSSGGAITVSAGTVLLSGDGDITTNVFSGAGNGGNIRLTADAIIALDDSDILAFARDGRGGNIALETPVFFGENYQPAPFGTDPVTLEANDRVDINASGALSSGTITLPDDRFLQQKLVELPENFVDASNLLANSCIARSEQGGSFIVTGSGGLPTRPGDAAVSNYPTGEIRPIPSETPTNNSVLPTLDRIAEAEGWHTLPNGELVLAKECR
jgi:filamentous hemagglutinin family protein